MKKYLAFLLLLPLLFSCRQTANETQSTVSLSSDSSAKGTPPPEMKTDTLAFYEAMMEEFENRESKILAEKESHLALKFTASHTYDSFSITRFYDKNLKLIYHFSDQGYEGGGSIQNKFLYNDQVLEYVYEYTMENEQESLYWSAKEKISALQIIDPEGNYHYKLQEEQGFEEDKSIMNNIFELESDLFQLQNGKYVYDDMQLTQSEYGEIKTGIHCEIDSLLFQHLRPEMK